MALSTDEWLQQTVAALLTEDAPAVDFVPVAAPDDEAQAVDFPRDCLPEHRRRVLAIAAAVTGHVPKLAVLMDATCVAFTEGRVLDWLEGLGELERRVGIA